MLTLKLPVYNLISHRLGFPGDTVIRNQPTSAGDTRDMDSIPGQEMQVRSLGLEDPLE